MSEPMKPRDPDWEVKVRDSFARQSLMQTIGAKIAALAPGTCEIELPYRRDLCQQHGFLHAGITTTIADSAAGYAAFSLMPPGASVLTVEFKVNFMAPAKANDSWRGAAWCAAGARSSWSKPKSWPKIKARRRRSPRCSPP